MVLVTSQMGGGSVRLWHLWDLPVIIILRAKWFSGEGKSAPACHSLVDSEDTVEGGQE